MSSETAICDDRALEAKHRQMWAMGDYAAVAGDLVAPLGPSLVEASGVVRGMRVLDVAAGSGNVAIPAALAGATVIASDLTPELLERGQAIAAERGVSLQWREANAEALPFADNDFDTVLSCVGVMFAPHHQRAADELVRVCRPGGTIGLINWTPGGFIGQMFATMKPYVPAPASDVQPPPLWGDEDHVRAMLGEKVTDVAAQKHTLSVDRFPNGEAFRDYFKANYGPTITAYRNIGGDAARVAALDAELVELGRRHLVGSSTMEWEYLLVIAHKR